MKKVAINTLNSRSPGLRRTMEPRKAYNFLSTDNLHADDGEPVNKDIA
jgi:hypothetical protein